ncbi:MAG TPA: hypothetical protein VMW35_21110, partial [Myxococcota bacterium]|nr:hypothetical protein [Myxococcota bacterium]
VKCGEERADRIGGAPRRPRMPPGVLDQLPIGSEAIGEFGRVRPQPPLAAGKVPQHPLRRASVRVRSTFDPVAVSVRHDCRGNGVKERPQVGRALRQLAQAVDGQAPVEPRGEVEQLPLDLRALELEPLQRDPCVVAHDAPAPVRRLEVREVDDTHSC